MQPTPASYPGNRSDGLRRRRLARRLDCRWLYSAQALVSTLPLPPAACSHCLTLQHLPCFPILLPHRLPAPDVRIKPQTLRSPYRRDWQHVPRIHRLHMRRHHINLPRCVSFLAPSSRRVYRLHFVSSPVQSSRPFHLHPIHRAAFLRPHTTKSYRSLSPQGNATLNPIVRAFSKNAACEISPDCFGFFLAHSHHFSFGSATAIIHGITMVCRFVIPRVPSLSVIPNEAG